MNRPFPTIDSHLHLWDLADQCPAWITPDLGELHQTFTANRARGELDRASIDYAILVQAEDSVGDTEFMLDAAGRHPWICGVVGWVPLDTPNEVEILLEQWLQLPTFCGVRHLVHDDPRDDFLWLPTVRDSLKMLANADVPFDIPDAYPRHLAAGATTALAIPELTIVIDHLGKPPLGSGSESYSLWKDQLESCARAPNTVAKLSGLRIPGSRYDVPTLRPVFDAALEMFGPERLMYGGDWPMNVPAGGYRPTWEVLDVLISTLSKDEQDHVRGRTAARTYGKGGIPPQPSP